MADDDKPDLEPVEEDLRAEDQEYNPAVEPEKSRAWLNLLQESEDAFESWNSHCDNIDKQFASLEYLAQMVRDKEFQMFWANCEVLKPSIYAKPPVPVVVPKFKDRRPVYQAASEVMERCAVVAFDLTHINDLMLLVRDDVAMIGRGVAWCRYEEQGDNYDYEKVCIDFKDRRDFLHSISRNWREVTWVAAASYMTRSEARKRFHEFSGDAYQDAEYKVNREAKEVGGADDRERGKFWEIWDKPSKRVVWVAEGCEEILDEAEPHLKLQDYFPCPKPAYGTVQRRSLVPVPDVLQYKDQLDEVNLLTGRIHALSDSLEVKGFYPAGGSEIAEAVQKAVETHTPGRVLVPISNWASFGGSKEVIIWMPIQEIATTIQALVMLRKQVIEDIYQIMGLSDIMRGATDPTETLGAQQLKTQYGSTRIRDKQQELVRLARDLVAITSEIITEKFDEVTIIEMSQTQLPTREMQQKKAQQLINDVEQLRQAVQRMQQEQPPPQPGQDPQQQQDDPTAQWATHLQQLEQQVQQKLQAMAKEPTIEQVLHFLKDNKAKAFVLDIETDSTIQADEQAEKQSRIEFIGGLSSLLPQLAQMIQMDPETATFAGELLKFSVGPFRAGRSLDGSIDELIELMKKKSEGPRPDDPVTAKGKIDLQVEQLKQQTEDKRLQQEAQFKQQELEQKDRHKQWEIQGKQAIEAVKMRSQQGDRRAEIEIQANQEQMHDREVHQMEMIKKQAEVQATQVKAQVAQQTAQARSQDMQSRQRERQQAQTFKQQNLANRGRPV